MRAKIVVPLLVLAAAAPAAAQRTVCTPPIRPGSEQSPVNIVGAVAARMDSVSTNYSTVQGVVANTGYEIRVNVSPGNYLTVDGVRFQLEEFHFHWPGEHQVDGDTFAVEIHMVHKTAHGVAVALGTWVRIGAHNPAWDVMWNNLPARGAPSFRMLVDIPHLFAIGSLNAEQVYRYCGSLTTPRFDEPVTWLVRNHPIEMSRDQVIKLRGVMDRWSRPLQPLNRRQIRYWIP
jgi:carbonic anhydrase